MAFKLKDLWKAYRIFESHNQYFELVQNDLNVLDMDKRIIFDIDSYDLNSILFTKNIYVHNPPEHFDKMRALWTQLLQDADESNNIILTIGPLAIFETIVNIKRSVTRLNDDKTFNYLKSSAFADEFNKLTQRIIELEDGKGGEVRWSDVSDALQRVWVISKRVLNMLDELNSEDDVGLKRLLSLIKENKIQYLEEFLKAENLSIELSDFDVNRADKFDFDRGLNYLKQNRRPSKMQPFFSSIDMLRMAAASNMLPRLHQKDINNYIVSNGQHTLTAWDKSWDGKMSMAPFRPSQSACYLGRVINFSNNDYQEAKHEANEAQLLTKRILRYIKKMPEIQDLLNRKLSAKEKLNNEIKISNKLNLQLLSWQTSFMDLYNPKEKIDFFDKLPKVNINEILKLKRITGSEQGRKKISDEIRIATKELIGGYSEIFDFEKLPLFGPIGEVYTDLQRWLNE